MPGAPLQDGHVSPTVKHGGGSMMVWGCFTVQGIGNLVRIEDILNAYLYINILKDDLPGTFDWYALGKVILCFNTIITRSTQPISPRNGSQTRASRFWHSLCSRQTSIPLKSSGSGSSLDYPTTRHRRRASIGFGSVPRMFGMGLPKMNASS